MKYLGGSGEACARCTPKGDGIHGEESQDDPLESFLQDHSTAALAVEPFELQVTKDKEQVASQVQSGETA